MTKPKFDSDFKSRVASYVAYFSDAAYEANPPYDPFEDITTPRRRRRRLSLKQITAQGKKLGVDTTITTRDGTVTLHFSERSVLGTLPNTTDDASEWN